MLVKEIKLPFSSLSLRLAKAINSCSLFIYKEATATYKLKDSLN
jgi:hypothetical protein